MKFLISQVKMLKTLNDAIYKILCLRKTFWQRASYAFIIFAISVFIPIFTVYNLKMQALHLTDLDRCPVCYGRSICNEIYSNKILVKEHRWQNVFYNNVQNIYHGYRNTTNVILKKLAFDGQIVKFDKNLCDTFHLNNNCTTNDLFNDTSKSVYSKIIDRVSYQKVDEMDPRRPVGLIFCPYPDGIYDFLEPILKKKISIKSYRENLLNTWTMLSLNAEPIILQILNKSHGWHVPEYIGVCGRLEVVSDEGTPLAKLMDISWSRKLRIAYQILDMAQDFTFKHDRYRFYLFDWTINNIVVNEKDEVSFVDLEDVIVLDKDIKPNNDLPKWYETAIVYKFSESLICHHFISDYNVVAACNVLTGNNVFQPFLHPIPNSYLQKGLLTYMLDRCLHGNDKFAAATALQTQISDLLNEEKINKMSMTSKLPTKLNNSRWFQERNNTV